MAIHWDEVARDTTTVVAADQMGEQLRNNSFMA